MTLEEARETFLNRGWIKAEGGTYFDGDKWREAVMVISDYLQKEQCEDCISRQAAIDALNDEYHGMISDESMKIYQIINWLSELPSAQPEVRPIDYQDCSNAMLKMWMDNVLTDGEYNRIMDKLNAHWGKRDG